MNRRFYTSDDIEMARARGQKELIVDEPDVVLDLAREAAARYGIEIVQRGESSSPSLFSFTRSSPSFDLEKWRKHFPILRQGVYLATCFQAPLSLRVRDAIVEFLNEWTEGEIGQEDWFQRLHLTRAAFAQLINADPSEVAIASSLSQALASIVSSLDLSGRRNRVVLTEAEFPAVTCFWLAQQRHGVELAWIPFRKGSIDATEYESTIDERTLLTCVSHVCYQNGFKQELGSICEIAHRKGSLLFVDAYQSLGIEPVNVKEADIDFLAAGAGKYLLGISGVAFLYVKKALIPYLEPTVTGWLGQENPLQAGLGRFQYARDGRRFETGTPSLVSVIAARAGLETIHELGCHQIKAWVDEISRYTLQELGRKGLETTSPTDLNRKGTITSILVPDPERVETGLRRRGIFSSSVGNLLRFSSHFFVTREDIDRALNALEEVLKEMGRRDPTRLRLESASVPNRE